MVGHAEDHLGDKAHELEVGVGEGGPASETVGPSAGGFPSEKKPQKASHRKPGKTGQHVDPGKAVHFPLFPPE